MDKHSLAYLFENEEIYLFAEDKINEARHADTKVLQVLATLETNLQEAEAKLDSLDIDKAPASPQSNVAVEEIKAVSTEKADLITKEQAVEVPKVPVLQKIQTKLLILVHASTPENLEFIAKIAAALRLETEAYIIKQIDKTDNLQKDILAEFDFNFCLSFGFTMNGLLSMAHEVLQIDQRKYVLSLALNEVKDNKQVKALLWASLQQMFGLK